MAILTLLVMLSACQASYIDDWNKYVEQLVSEYPIQMGCIPQRMAADPTVKFQGVVVLYHGFTACPQQFDEWIPILASHGYDVLAPLLPGHGGVPSIDSNGTYTDYLDKLPRSLEGYENFVTAMNNIMIQVDGTRIVGGLSVGGAVATFAGTFLDEHGNPLFHRQLLMVPLLGLPKVIYDIGLSAMNAIPFVSRKVVGWGDPCEVERSKGRAGICHFEVSQVAAARDFGAKVLENIKTPKNGIQTQIVYDWDDTAVSVDKIQKLYKLYGKPEMGKSVCTLPQDKSHSFLSKYDTPDENKYWLNEITCRLTDFITQQSSAIAGVDTLDMEGYLTATAIPDDEWNHRGWYGCEFKCQETTCPYDRSIVQSCPAFEPTYSNVHQGLAAFDRIHVSVSNRFFDMMECVSSNCMDENGIGNRFLTECLQLCLAL